VQAWVSVVDFVSDILFIAQLWNDNGTPPVYRIVSLTFMVLAVATSMVLATSLFVGEKQSSQVSLRACGQVVLMQVCSKLLQGCVLLKLFDTSRF